MFRAIAVVYLVLSASGCAHQHASSTNGRGIVVRVVDGDTIVVRISGRDENVRLIGIDTSKP